MRFTRIAREAEEFDRALRDGSLQEMHAGELALTAALAASDVRPDPAFSADLRVSLLQAAHDGALVAGPPSRTSRRAKRRWTIAAPAAAVVLATGGVAFAVTGLATSRHATSAAVPSAGASALSTAQAQVTDLTRQIRAGRPSAASLSSLRVRALHLRDTLIAAYAGGRHPQAMWDLRAFAVSAISQLAEVRDQIPASLASLYASTLQTLVDVAAAAESTCPTCGLPPLQVPSSVAPLVHVPPIARPSGGIDPTPQTSTTPTVPVITPSVPPRPTTGPSSPVPPFPLPSPPIALPSAVPPLHL